MSALIIDPFEGSVVQMMLWYKCYCVYFLWYNPIYMNIEPGQLPVFYQMQAWMDTCSLSDAHLDS